MDHKERMEAALERKGLTMLQDYNSDYTTLCMNETPSGAWYVAEWFYDDVTEEWRHNLNRGYVYTIEELVRIPPVAALLEACKELLDALASEFGDNATFRPGGLFDAGIFAETAIAAFEGEQLGLELG